MATLLSKSIFQNTKHIFQKIINSSLGVFYLIFYLLAFKSTNTKMGLSPDAKERLGVVFDVVKTAFHIGFIPIVLYLGR